MKRLISMFFGKLSPSFLGIRQEIELITLSFPDSLLLFLSELQSTYENKYDLQWVSTDEEDGTTICQ